MKLIYISNSRIPTEKAYGISTVKISEAFAEEKIDLELIIPKVYNQSSDIFSFYKIKKIFKVKRLFCFDLTKIKIFEKFFYLLKFFSFSFFACAYVYFKNYKKFNEIIFFSHDNIPLYFLSFLTKNIFYDIHDFPSDNFINRRVMKKSFSFSVQTKWKVKALSEKFNVNQNNILYWPNGTDFSMFKIKLSKEEARNVLSLPKKNKIILYTGQLFSWKGVDTLIKSIDFLDEEIRIYLVGGAKNDVNYLKNNLKQASNKRIFFIPFQSHEKIPIWMRAADVSILPNTAKEQISLYYTSPMKLFEYMASGRPIVASDIPSIREILNKDNSLLAIADNPKSFSEKIKIALNNPERINEITENAGNDVRGYTWENRAKKIISYFKKFYKI
jgi:glycosyltransferase involved in cell wall biosynthesis